jgi:hypothetical protein
MDHLLGSYQAAHDRFGLCPKWHAPAFRDQSGRSVMSGRDAKVVAIAEIQISKLNPRTPSFPSTPSPRAPAGDNRSY